MDTSKLCMYCMQDNQGQEVCPHCGKHVAAPLIANHLTPGEILGGRFLVGRAVGQDPMGVVYMAYDLRKENRLRIREYLPRGVAFRTPNDPTVQVTPGQEDSYREGLEQTLARAQSANDPSQAMAHFEENGTLYVILRRAKAAAPVASDEEMDEEEAEELSLLEKLKNRLPLLLACFAVLAALVVCAIVLVTRNNADRTTTDTPTLSPFDEWKAPTATPSPTVSATGIGEITDVNQSWQNQQGGSNLSDGHDTTPVPDDYEPDWLTQVTAPPTDVPSQTAEAGPQPTDTPAPRVTIKPELINRKTDSATITQLQNRLMDLMWLDTQFSIGAYDDATKAAVKAFQQYVHDNYDRSMDVDGIAGQQTITWLNRDDAPIKLPEGATATPAPTETPTPTDTPAPTDTPEPTATPYLPSVDDVRKAQNRLIELNWMDASQATGVYDNATQLTLIDYQNYVNLLYPNASLNNQGILDETTMMWLMWSGAPTRPSVTATPTVEPTQETTPEPSAAPSQPIDESSSQEEILWLQNRLVELQWLKPDAVTGEYDTFTRSAVQMLQQYLIKRYTLELEADGTAGTVTLSYLNNAYNSPENPDPKTAVGPTVAPTEEPTPEPTEGPTPEPTEEPTPEPTEEPTPEPTEEPTPEPSEEPTPEPTEEPTPEPTEEPTPEPTEEPTPEPTEEPTPEPEPEPTAIPTDRQPAEILAEADAIDAASGTYDGMQVYALQSRLIELGWMTQKQAESDDIAHSMLGVYGSYTDLAVADFVAWCNANWQESWTELLGTDNLSYMPMAADRATLKLLASAELAPTNPTPAI